MRTGTPPDIRDRFGLPPDVWTDGYDAGYHVGRRDGRRLTAAWCALAAFLGASAAIVGLLAAIAG